MVSESFAVVVASVSERPENKHSTKRRLSEHQPSLFHAFRCKVIGHSTQPDSPLSTNFRLPVA